MNDRLDMKTVDFNRLTDFLKIMGDPTRLRLIFLLSEKEACVSELADQLNATQSVVSHHLKILKAHKLVIRRREGKQIFYSIADSHVSLIAKIGWEHIKEPK